MAETKTATLTHKVRNPQNLDEWLNIWTATAITTVDGNNTIYNYEITPSANWNISADNLGEIPVNKVTPTNFYNNEEQKNYTITNVTITSEPTNNDLGLTGNTVAIINEDGSLKESSGQFDDSETSYFNGKGKFVALPSYSLTGAVDNTSDVKVTLNKDTNAVSNIIINGSGKITTTYDNNTITLNLAENSVGTNELQDNSITPGKINWNYADNTDPDNPITMASKIKQTININSSTNDGIVSATNGNAQKTWATNNNGEPDWRLGKVTVKEQNIELIKYVRNFIRGFYDGGPISTSFIPSPSGVPEEPTNLTGTGSSYLFLINGTLGASDADYKMVFNTQKALYEDDDNNDWSTRLNATENNVTKNVTYE